MRTSAPVHCVTLEGHRSTVLDRAAGTRVSCLSGCVWLTQYGDHRDFILHAGDSFTIDGPGAVVMTAHHGAHLQLLAPDPDASRPPRPAGLAGLLRRILAPRWHSAARRLAGGSIPEC